ncbi:thiamine pyrophosphate-dependent enzyme [Methanolobus sediminis]|uniref:Thiamine pyrophosphate-dependent enzyme n=1 Tax=Methanolobus sediminis TaxID=3072978 RepID=A0AA51UK46_9EURY|nr:thiamine pyrophosphate-dependent enzyme [Methanolobus sediminis]WMW24752.1 thiamine pyrophosphate-dependent enzyme [Methanolobus sediminis]
MITEQIKSIKDLPLEENMFSGTPACAGCGGLLTLRHCLKMLGEKVVIVNAAGCFTLLSIYPFTPFRSSWLYTAMACAPAGAQGVRDALDILLEKGKIDPDENLKVVVLTGDGSAYDMGLSSTSGAIYRNLDFYYICYDNEAYGNTGFQESGSTPFASRTKTTSAGKEFAKKDLFEIWNSHKPPYLATISPAYPVDLANKFKKAEQYKGPKLFISLIPCPPGWSTDPSHTFKLAKLAVDTGVWALKESISGEVEHTVVPKKFKPVEDYLKEQGRFSHLFKPVRNEETLGKIQEMVNEYWKRYGILL